MKQHTEMCKQANIKNQSNANREVKLELKQGGPLLSVLFSLSTGGFNQRGQGHNDLQKLTSLYGFL